MLCPYCAEEIKDAAIVCRYCSHDLSPSRPLMEKVAGLEEQVDALTRDAENLRRELARYQVPAKDKPRRSKPASILSQILPYGVGPIFVLLLAHYLIVVQWDTSVIYLRMASILVPGIFGFALVRYEGQEIVWTTVFGVVVSILAVIAMSAVVSVIDHVPVLPHDSQDLRETISYGISIALAYVAGGFLAKFTDPTIPGPAAARSDLLVRFAERVARRGGPKNAPKGSDVMSILERVESIERALSGIMTAAAAAGSVYMGLTHS